MATANNRIRLRMERRRMGTEYIRAGLPPRYLFPSVSWPPCVASVLNVPPILPPPPPDRVAPLVRARGTSCAARRNHALPVARTEREGADGRACGAAGCAAQIPA